MVDKIFSITKTVTETNGRVGNRAPPFPGTSSRCSSNLNTVKREREREWSKKKKKKKIKQQEETQKTHVWRLCAYNALSSFALFWYLSRPLRRGGSWSTHRVTARHAAMHSKEDEISCCRKEEYRVPPRPGVSDLLFFHEVGRSRGCFPLGSSISNGKCLLSALRGCFRLWDINRLQTALESHPGRSNPRIPKTEDRRPKTEDRTTTGFENFFQDVIYTQVGEQLRWLCEISPILNSQILSR